MNRVDKLRKINACCIAIKWFEQHVDKSNQELWTMCERGDWMIWLIRSAKMDVDINIIKDLAIEFISMVIHYTGNNRQICIDCIYATYQYNNGWIDKGELIKHKNAIYTACNADATACNAASAASAAYDAANYAAAYATDAAATAYDDAAYDAAYDAAKKRIYKEQSEIIRYYIPTFPGDK